MSYCTVCGTKLKDSEKFCHECGHHNEEDLTSGTVPPKQSSIPSPEPKSGQNHPDNTNPVPSRKRLSGCTIAAIVGGSIIAVIMVFVIIGVIMAFSLTSGAVEAVETHLSDLKQGNIEKAYQGTTSDFQSVTSLNAYRQFVDSYPILKDTVSSSFSQREVDNGVASIGGTITDSSGKKAKLKVKLLKEGENWRIQSLELPDAVPGTTSSGGSKQKPKNSGQPSVGTVTFGSGRNEEGTLINPGKILPANAPKLHVDVELINHPIGQHVQFWVKHIPSGKTTKPTEGTIEGEGNGTVTYELPSPPGGKWPTGKWKIFILLGEDSEFTSDFTVR